ncbi:MAG: glycosyl hydrolase 53 family protein [Prevotella sp.]|nr:glycosyl hydrolase 53 family protein [Prevotella sp.]MBR7055184.1 glycosyl hydrolase 53 family protein [Prevotella sp.]
MRQIHIFLLSFLCIVSSKVTATDYQKVVGGDISMLTKYYEAGKTYMDADGNKLADAPAFLAYLKAQGLNSMRVRLFVDPSKASSTHKGEGVCQDLEYVKALGKQIKDAGLYFLLDFHYSDTWTDPGQHSTPSSWNSTDPTTLGNYLYDYTVDALTALKNAGAEPDDIQIGNEVTVGELWPTGKCYADGKSVTTGNITGTMANFALYLKRSAEACRLVCPDAKIVLHTELSNNGWGAKTLYNTLKAYGVDYDIIGLSYYPYFHGNLSVLESVLNSLTNDFPTKKIQIVETGFYYRWGQGTVSYEISQAGQKAFTDDLITLLNRYSNVNGLYWWWLEANEWGTSANVTTNWYYAGLWSNDNGKPCRALFSLKDFITDPAQVETPFTDQRGGENAYTIGGAKATPYTKGIVIKNGKKHIMK